MREDYAAEIAKTRQERPNLRFVVYDHSFEGNPAWFRFTPARQALAQACRSIGSRLASSRILG
jgi:hypothetical protein